MVSKAELHRALERDEFVPYFQPIVSLPTGQLAGFEILARLKHPEGGMIPPDMFIPLAEADGSICDITRQVLGKAVAAASHLPGSFHLAVNISPTQLGIDDLAVHIESIASRGGFPARRLVVEITESALTHNIEHARTVTQSLKDLGCRVALDDFGTGYSSLRHLQSLPFDEIKVDRSFVSSMTTHRESRKIVATVVGLGQSLGLTTVAEGVETEEQAEVLRWLGCDLGQGWLYGHPMPAADLSAFLSRPSVQPATTANSRWSFQSLHGLPAQRLAQLQAVFDGSPAALCFLSPQLRYVSLNQRLANLHGRTIDEYLGRHLSEMAPHIYAQAEPYLKRALAGEPTFDVEAVSRRPGHPDQFRLVSYQPVRDEANEILGVAVAITDITERKRIELALRESEDNYRHMVELNPQIPWIMNADLQAVEISPKWHELTGMPREGSLGQGWMDAMHPDDRTRILAIFRQCTRDRVPIDAEYRLRAPDGGWRWMRTRGSPRLDEQGNIIRWYGSVEDIDNSKRTENALRVSESQLRAIFNAARVGIIMMDAPSGALRMANPEACRIFGDPILPGPSSGDFSRWRAVNSEGRELEAHEYPIGRALRGEATPQQDYFCRFSDGREVHVAMAGSPLYAPDGTLTGAVVVAQDMGASREHVGDVVQRVVDGLRSAQ